MKKINRKNLLTGTAVVFATAAAGFIYELFSHGVYSFYMIYAFMIPLVLCLIPMLVLYSFREGEVPVLSMNLWNFGVAALTVGCIFKGVLDIYGTTNDKIVLYPILGGMLMINALITGFAAMRRKKTVPVEAGDTCRDR